MRLGDIFAAAKVFDKVTQLKLKPTFAYKLLKFTQKVKQEYELVEKQRVALIHEVTNTKDGEAAEVKPGSEEFNVYLTKLNNILMVEAELTPLDISLDELVNQLSSNDENKISVQELAILEPLFVEELKK